MPNIYYFKIYINHIVLLWILIAIVGIIIIFYDTFNGKSSVVYQIEMSSAGSLL